MMFKKKLLLIFAAVGIVHGHVEYQPEQVHLSYGDTVRNIVITWSTRDDTKKSIVEFGSDSLNIVARGSAKKFVDGGPKKRSQYIHRVTLYNLTSSTKYFYHCGSELGWSNIFWFVTPPEDDKWSPHIAIYGDMGNENAKSLPRLQEETQTELYDAILHVGDFAYDMDSENGEVGNAFMRQIESVAAYLPYMTCAGNHEEKYNFSHYKARFSMPGNTENLFYSLNMGPIHLISIFTEAYYYPKYGFQQAINQYRWLEEDLKTANLPENRIKHPWIIVIGHRPMYCTYVKFEECAQNISFVRTGIPDTNITGLEKLFMENGVDLEIWGHEHSYERFWPIYDLKIYNGSLEEPYTNPKSPVHIITGSAGCSEIPKEFSPPRPFMSGFRSTDYGYTRLKAYNSTHVHLEQVSIDKNDIIDEFWIIKDKHKFYSL